MVGKYNLEKHLQVVQITSGFLCSSSQIKTATYKQSTAPTNHTVHNGWKPLLHKDFEEQYPTWLQLLEFTFQS